MSYPDHAEVLAGLDGRRVLTLAIRSLPDTPHAVTPDDLFQSTRGCVPNLYETAGEEQNVWVVVGNPVGGSFPFDGGAVIDQSSVLVDINSKF